MRPTESRSTNDQQEIVKCLTQMPGQTRKRLVAAWLFRLFVSNKKTQNRPIRVWKMSSRGMDRRHTQRLVKWRLNFRSSWSMKLNWKRRVESNEWTLVFVATRIDRSWTTKYHLASMITFPPVDEADELLQFECGCWIRPKRRPSTKPDLKKQVCRPLRTDRVLPLLGYRL